MSVSSFGGSGNTQPESPKVAAPDAFCDHNGKFFSPINNNTGCPYCPMISLAKSQPEQKVKSHYGVCFSLQKKIVQVQKHIEMTSSASNNDSLCLIDPPLPGDPPATSHQVVRLCDESGNFFYSSSTRCRFCFKACANPRSHFQACSKVQEYARVLNSLRIGEQPAQGSTNANDDDDNEDANNDRNADASNDRDEKSTTKLNESIVDDPESSPDSENLQVVIQNGELLLPTPTVPENGKKRNCAFCSIEISDETNTKSHYGACTTLERHVVALQEKVMASGYELVDPPPIGEAVPPGKKCVRLCGDDGKFLLPNKTQCSFCFAAKTRPKTHFSRCSNFLRYLTELQDAAFSSPSMAPTSSSWSRAVTEETFVDSRLAEQCLTTAGGHWYCKNCGEKSHAYSTQKAALRHYETCPVRTKLNLEANSLDGTFAMVKKFNFRHLDGLYPSNEEDFQVLATEFPSNDDDNDDDDLQPQEHESKSENSRSHPPPPRIPDDFQVIHNEKSNQIIFRATRETNTEDLKLIVKTIISTGVECSILVNTGIHGASNGRFYYESFNNSSQDLPTSLDTIRFFQQDLQTLIDITTFNINFSLNIVSSHCPPCYTNKATIVIDLWCFSSCFVRFWDVSALEVFESYPSIFAADGIAPADGNMRATANYPREGKSKIIFDIPVSNEKAIEEWRKTLTNDHRPELKDRINDAVNHIKYLHPNDTGGKVGRCVLLHPDGITGERNVPLLHTHTSGAAEDNETFVIFYHKSPGTRNDPFVEILGYGAHQNLGQSTDGVQSYVIKQLAPHCIAFHPKKHVSLEDARRRDLRAKAWQLRKSFLKRFPACVYSFPQRFEGHQTVLKDANDEEVNPERMLKQEKSEKFKAAEAVMAGLQMLSDEKFKQCFLLFCNEVVPEWVDEIDEKIQRFSSKYALLYHCYTNLGCLPKYEEADEEVETEDDEEEKAELNETNEDDAKSAQKNDNDYQAEVPIKPKNTGIVFERKSGGSLTSSITAAAAAAAAAAATSATPAAPATSTNSGMTSQQEQELNKELKKKRREQRVFISELTLGKYRNLHDKNKKYKTEICGSQMFDENGKRKITTCHGAACWFFHANDSHRKFCSDWNVLGHCHSGKNCDCFHNPKNQVNGL